MVPHKVSGAGSETEDYLQTYQQQSRAGVSENASGGEFGKRFVVFDGTGAMGRCNE